MSDERYVREVDDDTLRREKARARELRQTAWWRRRIAAGLCHYCRRAVGPKALTVDHVVPLVRGGRSIRRAFLFIRASAARLVRVGSADPLHRPGRGGARSRA